jgi:nitrogen fixation NifU-like protein
LDRREQVARLVEHAKNPRHRGVIPDADVAVPGGAPECGGSVVVYLKGGEGGRIGALSFTGEGDTISMGSTSLLMELIHAEGMVLDDVLALDYEDFVDGIGREAIGSRTRNATMGLSAVKAAIRKYQKDRALTGSPERSPVA